MSAVKALPLDELVEEAQRVLSICNACRYCEGYCAVFPALERRLEFGENDVHYLANLCHNCGACLYACQYAPPHEFQLNFPKILAQVRKETYKKYAWPAAFANAFERNGVLVSLITACSLAAADDYAAGAEECPQHVARAYARLVSGDSCRWAVAADFARAARSGCGR